MQKDIFEIKDDSIDIDTIVNGVTNKIKNRKMNSEDRKLLRKNVVDIESEILDIINLYEKEKEINWEELYKFYPWLKFIPGKRKIMSILNKINRTLNSNRDAAFRNLIFLVKNIYLDSQNK